MRREEKIGGQLKPQRVDCNSSSELIKTCKILLISIHILVALDSNLDSICLIKSSCPDSSLNDSGYPKIPGLPFYILGRILVCRD